MRSNHFGNQRKCSQIADSVSSEPLPKPLFLAPATLEFKLGDAYDSLSAVVGLDEDSLCSPGGQLNIYKDGELALSVWLVYYQPIKVELNVKDVNLLAAEALEFPGEGGCSHIDIANPLLFKDE